MPRPPKPWFWVRREVYLVTVDGTRHNLDPDKAEAEKQFHILMARRATAPPSPEPGVLTTVEVLDKYLDWCKRHRAARTFEWYRDHVQSFVAHHAAQSVRPHTELRPFHVLEWVDAHPDWGPAYRRGAIIAVQRPYNWAEKVGHIKDTPIKHVEKPKATRRENPVTKEDWRRIKARYPAGDPFVLLLEFSWESGCRPQESKRIEARHVLLPKKRVVTCPRHRTPTAADHSPTTGRASRASWISCGTACGGGRCPPATRPA